MKNPSRRQLLQTGVAAAALAIAPRAAAQDAGGRPNILWLVSEDTNPFVGAYGDRLARTPNIDALAESGLLYRNAFCAGPVCAVSRFAILTGVHPESCAPAQHMRARAVLPDLLRTYPDLLREAATIARTMPRRTTTATSIRRGSGMPTARMPTGGTGPKAALSWPSSTRA